MVKKPKKAVKARKLVRGYLERVSSAAFSDFPKQLTDLVGREHGVYALYKGDQLYYVGLATNLRNRIKQHLRDRHAEKSPLLHTEHNRGQQSIDSPIQSRDRIFAHRF